MDWVGRYIYWAETVTLTKKSPTFSVHATKTPTNSTANTDDQSAVEPIRKSTVETTRKSSVVNRLDLNSLKMEVVLLRNKTVTNLLVEPLQG